MCFHIPGVPPSLINCIDFISGGMETDQNILSREEMMFYLRDVQNLSGCFWGQDDGL